MGTTSAVPTSTRAPGQSTVGDPAAPSIAPAVVLLAGLTAGLLAHSLRTLHEAIFMGRLDLVAAASPDADCGDPDRDPVGRLRNRACQMMGSWAAGAVAPRQISTGDRLVALLGRRPA